MGKITILPETTKNPISLIGERAGVCWGADILDDEKIRRRKYNWKQSLTGLLMIGKGLKIIVEQRTTKIFLKMKLQMFLRKNCLFQNIRQLDYLNLTGHGGGFSIGYLQDGAETNLRSLLVLREMTD